MNRLGIHPGAARSTALFQLATEIPAAILARTLGIHTDVAVSWQRLSAGDWANYAAEVSRRLMPATDRSIYLQAAGVLIRQAFVRWTG